MAFNAVEAATSGFGLLRTRFPAALGWAAANLVGGIVLVVVALILIVLTAGVSALGGLASRDPSSIGPGVIGSLIVAGLFVLAGALLLSAVLQCAVFRTILRPEERGFAQIRVGADEVRMTLLYFILFLLFCGGFLVLSLVQVGLTAARLGGLGVLLFLAYGLWFATQFWLASPMTFATRRLQVFGSWDLVRGRFWPLLGSLLLTCVFVAIVWIVGVAVQYAIQLALGLNAFSAAAVGQEATADPGAFALAMLVNLVLSFLLSVVIFPIGVAAPATAYRDIAGPPAERQADVFS